MRGKLEIDTVPGVGRSPDQVWTRERGVNAEIAKRQPELAAVMERINGQVRDLRDIFANQHYVHPDFRGSTSIKAVLPVLCPELPYKELAIREAPRLQTPGGR